MLKIRNLIFVLGLSPLLSLAWQLPNQAQINDCRCNRSSATAGRNSGANTGASQTTILSVPPITEGQAAGGVRTITATTPTGTIINIPIRFDLAKEIAVGISTVGNLVAGTQPIQISAEKTELNSSNITVINGAAENTVFITLLPSLQSTVNQLATTIIQNLINATNGKNLPPVIVLMIGGEGVENAAVFVTNSLTAAGVSLPRAQAIVQSLNGLCLSPSVISQTEKLLSVDPNKLNDAIIAYDSIIVDSKAEDIKNVYQNPDFLLAGQILRQLRTSIQ